MGRVRCPLLVTQGDQDLLIPADRGAAFAEATGAELVELEDVGHCPHARHPVPFNLLLRDFAERAYGAPRRRAAVAPRDPPPQARAVRLLARSASATPGATSRSRASCARCSPSLEIDWLAQDPVTRVLERCGERIHPASAPLANESRHIAAESREHELNVFQAWRRMDEILLANFMLFHDVATRPSRTTSGSATRRGSSTTTCTRTPSSRPPPTAS